MSVPGTAAHGVQDVPSKRVHRIVLETSVLITNSQTLVPSVAPKIPAPALKACPWPNAGGAGAIADQLLPVTLYDAPSTPPPALRRKARICVVLTGTSVQSFWLIVALVAKTLPSPPICDPTTMLGQTPLAFDRL